MNKTKAFINTVVFFVAILALVGCVTKDYPLHDDYINQAAAKTCKFNRLEQEHPGDDYINQAAAKTCEFNQLEKKYPKDPHLKALRTTFNAASDKFKENINKVNTKNPPYKYTTYDYQNLIIKYKFAYSNLLIMDNILISGYKQCVKLELEPSTHGQPAPPVNQQQPLSPDTTQPIQMMNEGQFGVTNITPPPPIF